MRNLIVLALSSFALTFVCCWAAPVANAQALDAGSEIAASLSAYKKADYSAALTHAQKAVVLAPQMTEAHLTLALVADHICFLWSGSFPDDLAGNFPGKNACTLAAQEYENVLRLDGNHREALQNLAYLLYQSYGLARADESESYYRKALRLQPEDLDLMGAVAAMDYHRSWRDIIDTKSQLKTAFKNPFIQFRFCRELRNRNQARLDEGISLAARGLNVRRNNVDLMGFLSGLYRLRAEIQCGDWRSYRADRNSATVWNRLRSKWKQEGPEDFLQKAPPAPGPV